MNEKIRFSIVCTLGHIVTYTLIGAIIYQLLYKPFWEAPLPLFGSYLRLPSEPDLWKHVTTWQFPGQLIRGFLISLVLLPFLEIFKRYNELKCTLIFAALYFVLAHLAATAPSAANIEGFIYMKPELVKPFFLAGQPEAILHGLVLGFILAKFGFKKSK